MAAQLIEARERLTGTLGRLPTVAELATELGLDETEVTAALRQVSQGEWRTSTGAPTTDAPDLPPVSVVLRMIQQEVNQLSQRLAELVERVEQ
jgi:DNA-directed RNA polymerase specialized sigma subunit